MDLRRGLCREYAKTAHYVNSRMKSLTDMEYEKKCTERENEMFKENFKNHNHIIANRC